jgi:hypothetical protein
MLEPSMYESILASGGISREVALGRPYLRYQLGEVG